MADVEKNYDYHIIINLYNVECETGWQGGCHMWVCYDDANLAA